MKNFRRLSWMDWIAAGFSLLAVILGLLVAEHVFENIPHIEDEMAYVWEAEVISRGDLAIPSPKFEKAFLVPFVVDYEGMRFGKYPIGWPSLLTAGILLGLRRLVNPLLSGLGVWLTYSLGKRIARPSVGLLAAFLTLTSPFFLMNAGSLLSHPFGLVCTLGFTISWWDLFVVRTQKVPAWLITLTMTLSFGALTLTRPLTAVGLALPFFFHGLWILWKGTRQQRIELVSFGIGAALIGSLYFVWQYTLTGDPALNPYTLWWPYDKIGFGPDVGVIGHNWDTVRYSLKVHFRSLNNDLFGWLYLSWLFLPFGLLAIRKDRKAWLPLSVFFSLVLVYTAYWIGSWLFGPRYYYESLFSLTLLTSLGIHWLAGWAIMAGQTFTDGKALRIRRLGITALTALLVLSNLVFYLPPRLDFMFDLYTISRSDLEPFEELIEQGWTQTLVIVHVDSWMEYGALLELENPYLDTDLIFCLSAGESGNQIITRYYQQLGYTVYHYYPGDAEFALYSSEK